MILKSKICGVSDSKTLNYIINHNHPPQFIGFVVNYPKSKRYLNLDKLQTLLKVEKKKSDWLWRLRPFCPGMFYEGLRRCNARPVLTVRGHLIGHSKGN